MELKNNLYTIVSKEGVGLMVSYTIKLIPSCGIYQAHFPGEPITPGVCIVQMAKELIEELLTEQTAVAHHLEITKVKNVKFLSIISPKEHQQITYQIKKLEQSEAEKNIEAQVVVLYEEKAMAKISLIMHVG